MSLEKLSETSPPLDVKSSQPLNKWCIIPIAIGIILLIGSVVATGCLYQHLKHLSLAIAGGGVIVCAISLIVGYFVAKWDTSKPNKEASTHDSTSGKPDLTEQVRIANTINSPRQEDLSSGKPVRTTQGSNNLSFPYTNAPIIKGSPCQSVETIKEKLDENKKRLNKTDYPEVIKFENTRNTPYTRKIVVQGVGTYHLKALIGSQRGKEDFPIEDVSSMDAKQLSTHLTTEGRRWKSLFYVRAPITDAEQVELSKSIPSTKLNQLPTERVGNSCFVNTAIQTAGALPPCFQRFNPAKNRLLQRQNESIEMLGKRQEFQKLGWEMITQIFCGDIAVGIKALIEALDQADGKITDLQSGGDACCLLIRMIDVLSDDVLINNFMLPSPSEIEDLAKLIDLLSQELGREKSRNQEYAPVLCLRNKQGLPYPLTEIVIPNIGTYILMVVHTGTNTLATNTQPGGIGHVTPIIRKDYTTTNPGFAQLDDIRPGREIEKSHDSVKKLLGQAVGWSSAYYIRKEDFVFCPPCERVPCEFPHGEETHFVNAALQIMAHLPLRWLFHPYQHILRQEGDEKLYDFNRRQTMQDTGYTLIKMILDKQPASQLVSFMKEVNFALEEIDPSLHFDSDGSSNTMHFIEAMLRVLLKGNSTGGAPLLTCTSKINDSEGIKLEIEKAKAKHQKKGDYAPVLCFTNDVKGTYKSEIVVDKTLYRLEAVIAKDKGKEIPLIRTGRKGDKEQYFELGEVKREITENQLANKLSKPEGQVLYYARATPATIWNIDTQNGNNVPKSEFNKLPGESTGSAAKNDCFVNSTLQILSHFSCLHPLFDPASHPLTAVNGESKESFEGRKKVQSQCGGYIDLISKQGGTKGSSSFVNSLQTTFNDMKGQYIKVCTETLLDSIEEIMCYGSSANKLICKMGSGIINNAQSIVKQIQSQKVQQKRTEDFPILCFKNQGVSSKYQPEMQINGGTYRLEAVVTGKGIDDPLDSITYAMPILRTKTGKYVAVDNKKQSVYHVSENILSSMLSSGQDWQLAFYSKV